MRRERWLIAAMGTLLQMCLGTVYAWSFFQKPLVHQFGWSNTQTMAAFSIAICCLGLSAAWGGVNLQRIGARRLAISGALIYALGYFLAAWALHIESLALLYLGFGVAGGVGLGLGYVTPVATVAKWFPDRRGLVTGMVVMGFGFGAILMSKIIAPLLLTTTDQDLVKVFALIGLSLLVMGLPAAAHMKEPPAGYAPAGLKAPVPSSVPAHGSVDTTNRLLRSPTFLVMWTLFFCNICAGIMFIGLQSPMLQDLLVKSGRHISDDALIAEGANLIAISSVFNGLGRFFWGAWSDRIGRIQAFRLIMGSQLVIFIGLIFVDTPWLFSMMVCYVLACYGGGFGTMPSFITDVFGEKLMPVLYGAMLTAWSIAGLVGPLAAAQIRDQYAAQASVYTYTFGATLLALGLVASLKLKPALTQRQLI